MTKLQEFELHLNKVLSYIEVNKSQEQGVTSDIEGFIAWVFNNMGFKDNT